MIPYELQLRFSKILAAFIQDTKSFILKGVIFYLFNLALCTTPCANGGKCIRPDTCQCPKKWSGPTCETGMHMFFIKYLVNKEQTNVGCIVMSNEL